MMSKDRPQHDNDPLVSAGYRDLAKERAPERLDHAILREARSAVRPTYGRLRLWVRPLAWAATVVISLAIVLQMTQLPEPEPQRAEPRETATEPGSVEEPPEQEAAADAFMPASVEVLREAEDMARVRSGSADELVLPTAAAPTTLQKEADPRHCDAEARAAADSWAACIEQLEADGLVAEARAERLVFREFHPDY